MGTTNTTAGSPSNDRFGSSWLVSLSLSSAATELVVVLFSPVEVVCVTFSRFVLLLHANVGVMCTTRHLFAQMSATRKIRKRRVGRNEARREENDDHDIPDNDDDNKDANAPIASWRNHANIVVVLIHTFAASAARIATNICLVCFISRKALHTPKNTVGVGGMVSDRTERSV